MKPRALLILAGLAFAVSFGLPAYGDANGLACLRFCWEVLGEDPGGRLGMWLYYVAFVPTNLGFVALVITGLNTDRWPKARLAVATVLGLHVFSWLPLNLGDIGTLGIGYYLWLVAYALLLTAQISQIHARRRAPADQ